MREHSIIVTKPDAARLRGLLAAYARSAVRDHAHLHELGAELDRAAILDATDMPADVITMDAQVRIVDLVSGARNDYTLAFPEDADVNAGRISVLAPLGTALLGYREGDEIEWRMPGGLRRLRIDRVIQPGPRRAESGSAHGAVAVQ